MPLVKLDATDAIGVVESSKGTFIIIRGDGTTASGYPGAPLYFGDSLETEKGSRAAFKFIYGTAFSISENARLPMDEYVYDPLDPSEKAEFSWPRKMFKFLSGLGVHDGSDGESHDPTRGVLGIRN